MTRPDVRQEVESLRAEIERHNRLYYVEAAPVISDRDYDRLMERLQAIEAAHPELVTPENTQILLPNGSVWGSPIINRSTYPGTGEVKVSFPVPAGKPAMLIGEQIVEELRRDKRLQPGKEPVVHISKVIETPDPRHPFVELTVVAKATPSDVDVVKQTLLDRIGALVGRQDEAPASESKAPSV